MFHQMLAAQLAKFNLDPDKVPEKEAWTAFLEAVSQTYEQRTTEQERLQAVLDNVADAIITFDENGRIEWFNRAAEQMFGYTAVEIQGHSLELLLPDPHRVQLEQDTLALSTDKDDGRADILSIRNEAAGQRRSGEIFPIAFTISQMRTQGERQFIAIARDITQRKQDEAALLAAKEEAEAANRSKSKYLANTSHEIRTPLSAIIGLTSLLLDTDLNPDQRVYAETARQSSNTLLNILNDILDLSKIEAGKLDIISRPFHLQASILEVIHLLEATVVDKPLTLKTNFDDQIPQVYLGDDFRLRQIMTNLISNAIKFTEEGEICVQLSGKPLLHDQFELLVSVIDTGVGLPDDYKKWLFEAFQQGNLPKNVHSGTGLGLAITQRLVTLMHGRIWVETEMNKGTAFHFTLPLTISDEPTAEDFSDRVKAFDPEMVKTHPLRILVAEDNATNQKVTLWMLEHLGYQADLAANGREVLVALQEKNYDLILLDMQMPEMDGLATTKEIRQTFPEDKQPWIIAVTADTQTLNRDIALANGLNDYLSKPVQAEALITALCLCPTRAIDADSVAVSVKVNRETQRMLDQTMLENIVDHDADRLNNLLAIFIEEYDSLFLKLETAVANQNYESIRQMAHALKGSCATIALTSLTEIFNQIESMTDHPDTVTEIKGKVLTAQSEYRKVITYLHTLKL